MTGNRRIRSHKFAMGNATISENGTKCEIVVPGFSHAAFDRKGNVMPSVIGRYFEIGRVAAVTNPAFLVRKLFRSGMTVFTVVMHYEYRLPLYAKAGVITGQQFKLVTQLVDLGKSSFLMVSEMYDFADDVLLAVLQFKYVLIDLTTRKSVPVPDEFKSKFGTYFKPEQAVKPFQPQSSPHGSQSRNAHVVKRVIEPSDIDANGHVNNSAYLLMCMDCAADATFKDKLANFKDDIALYQLREMDIIYAKECRYGDDIDIHCWEDARDRNTLHFQINKKENTPAFHCQMVFFSNTASAHL